MAREAFIQPDIIRMDLPGGGWVELKNKLSNGESKHLNAKAFSVAVDTNAVNGFVPVIDIGAFGMAKILAWVVDWDLTQNGKVMPINRDSVFNLDPEVATEIEGVIDAHVEALGREKNALDGNASVAVLSP